jgi:hypothetical protein
MANTNAIMFLVALGALISYTIMLLGIFIANVFGSSQKESRELKLLSTRNEVFIKEYMDFKNDLVNWETLYLA